jgi:hypothetical protein
MANHTITLAAGSFFSTVSRALSDPGSGILTVKDDGYLIAAASSFEHGVVLGSASNNWTVNLLSGSIGTYAAGKAGLLLAATGVGVPSSVSIGADGDLFGTAWGLRTEHKTNIVNKGAIFATAGDAILEAATATGDYKITNSGVIAGDVSGISLLGAGVHTIVNSGTIVGNGNGIFGDTVSVAGIEKVTNSGLIGSVQLGLGDDVFTNFAKVGNKTKHGQIGSVDLGAGNDIFNGGKFAELVGDGAGTDIYKLGAGNDFFVANPSTGTSGDDFVNGGAGIDTYSYFGSTTIFINLDTVAHFGNPAQQATGSLDIGTDIVIGFEKAIGGDGDDRIYGNASANELQGGAGLDQLYGFGGNDIIRGGDDGDFLVGGTGNDELHGGLDGDSCFGEAGNDILLGEGGEDFLVGGAGRDRLEGGADLDRFYFGSTLDSPVGATKRDVIGDFEQGVDVIVLNNIDANIATAGDDTFSLIGLAAFSGAGGELRFKYAKGNTIVEGDVNGDAKADFQIELQGHFVLTGANFDL